MNIDKLGFTPGPWKESKQSINDIYQVRGRGCLVAMVEMHAGNAVHQNAKLIAAATEMLEALIDDSIQAYNLDMDNPMYQGKPPIKHKAIIEQASGWPWGSIKKVIEESER